MKTSYYILAILIAASSSLCAQVNSKALSKSILISAKEVRIDSLLHIFSRQTGIGFSFNSNKIRPSKKVTVPKAKQTLAEWLNMLHRETGITHRVVGNHIILVDTKQPVQHKQIRKPERATLKINDNKIRAERSGSINEMERSVTSNAAKEDIILRDARTGRVLHSVSTSTIKTVEPDSFKVTFLSFDSLKELKMTAIRVGGNHVGANQNPTKNNRSNSIPADGQSLALKPMTKIDLGPGGLALSFQRRLSNKMIIELSLVAGGGYAISADEFKYKVGGLSAPDIFITANPRFYYNRRQLASKGRSLSRNAGNYIGFRLKYITDMFAENFVVWDAFLLNVHLGTQRPLGKRWVLNGHAGPGYATPQSIFYNTWLKGHSRFYPSVELKIGYVFSRNDE